MVCEDYDLCDNCHSAGVHDHQMLKIEHPADAISVMSTVTTVFSLCREISFSYSLRSWKMIRRVFCLDSEFTPRAMRLCKSLASFRIVRHFGGRRRASDVESPVFE